MLDFAVLAAGAALAVLSCPNEAFSAGWGFLGLISLVPVFWFTARRSWVVSALGGALWITLVIFLSQFWLIAFHPLAFPLVLLFQVPWYAGAFALSSVLWRRFPRSALWFQALAWTALEFLRIQGFFSYPYGSLASSFWSWPLAWQSADLVGTSGLTFLLAWTSAWTAALVSGRQTWARLRLDLAAGLALWAADLGYGAWMLSSPDRGPLWRPALVQPAQDPWKGGPNAYASALDQLEAQSRAALVGGPDAVVWPETAFVPSVEFHTRYHEVPESLRLVRRLESFLGESGSVPFLVGNDHREKADDGTVRDYNAVLAWDGARWSGRYEKNRLVPFTESFPYKDLLPWVYDLLKESDTHFWHPGRNRLPLNVGGVLVGTPVCFEDSFPDGARAFSLAGAKALANLTNDSWAPGTASRMQHLSLAVFRTVETRLPLVRAGNDGATAAVSSRGEVLALLPVGPAGHLQAEVRLGTGEPTAYTRFGDWLPWSALVVLVVALAWKPRRGSDVDKAGQL